MAVLGRIIVGHDLRSSGDIALWSAKALAGRCQAALKVIHVIEPKPFHYKISHPLDSSRYPEAIARRVGQSLEARLLDAEFTRIQVQYEVCAGQPFVELIVACRAWQADLIVVGAPTKAPIHILGSTSERVIRKASVPALITPTPLKADAKTFLVATDFSSGAQHAAKEAVALAQYFGARIFFLHVLDAYPLAAYAYPDEVVSCIPQLSAEDIEAEWSWFLAPLKLEAIVREQRTVEGIAANTIVEQAQSLKVDLIIMGTRGLTGLEHMLVGSVAEKVTRTAPCPVLTVRPDAYEFKLPYSQRSLS